MEKSTRKTSRVIGYWMSEKKSQKLNWSEFASVCRDNGYSLVKINLDMPLEEQGPFTVILHKLTDIFALAIQGNAKAASMIEQVQCYIRRHPEIAVIDPLENVRKLLDRYISYRVIHDSNLEDIDVFIPTFVELTSDDPEVNLKILRSAGIGFPFVCKPSVAHGTRDCHKMTVIFNENGVVDCKPPCVAQTFVNHNAILYKIFILGDDYKVVERPSLKNFYPSDRKSIHFDTHEVSKADSSSSLNILDPNDREGAAAAVQADPDKLATIASTVRRELGMSLLGIDVVVENTTGRHAVIDINAYPSYDGYPNFFDNLMNCILKTIDYHKSKINCNQKGSENKSPNEDRIDQDDSGFDTSDSSDEQKRKQRLKCLIPSANRATASSTITINNKKCQERQH